MELPEPSRASQEKGVLLQSPPSMTPNAFLYFSGIRAVEFPSFSQLPPGSVFSTVILCSVTSGEAVPPMPKFQQSLSAAFPRPVFLSPRFEGQSGKPWPSDHFPGRVLWKGWVILRVCSYKRLRLWCEGPGL